MDTLQRMKKTTTRGRKKIEIKELEKNANKQVTFSKRRAGLFKKASELCVLCNAELAVIVFSPANKVFCFGQPNLEAVLRRYLRGSALESEPTAVAVRDNNSSSAYYRDVNRQYEEAVKTLELEKKRLAEIQNLAKVWDRGNWWEEPIHEMHMEQLEQYTVAMHELRRKVASRADELMMKVAALPPTASFYRANSFSALASGSYGDFLNPFSGHLGDTKFEF